MTFYILLKSDSTINYYYNGEGLKKKQKAVGGLIQPVYLTTGVTAYINENGINENLSVNDIATTNFKLNGVFDKYLFVDKEVRGNVLYEFETKDLYESFRLSFELAKMVQKLEKTA